MDDFVNILQRDYGLKPQGKSAPMSASKSVDPLSSPASIYRTTSTGKSKNGSNRGSRSSAPFISETLQDDLFFAPNGTKSSSSTRNASGSVGDDLLGVSGGGGGSSGSVVYDDVFGGPPKFTPPVYTARPPAATAPPSFDDLFGVPTKPQSSTSSKSSSLPVFDAPFYDDDIFGGVPGIRNTTVAYDDVFGGGSTVGTSPGVLEDLLGGFGISQSRDKASVDQQAEVAPETTSTIAGDTAADELLPGFGGVEPRATADAQAKSFGMTNDSTASIQRPFVAQGADYTGSSDTGPLKTSVGGSGRKESSNIVNEDIAPSINSSPPSPAAPPSNLKPANSGRRRESNSTSPNPGHPNVAKGSVDSDYVRKNHYSTSTLKEQHKSSSSSPKPQFMRGSEAASVGSPSRRARQVHDKVDDSMPAAKPVQGRQADEFWISVEDVKLVTQPTAAPPPSRPPPVPGSNHTYAPRKSAVSKAESKKNSASGFPEASSTNSSNDFEELSAGGSRGRKDTRKEAAAIVQEDDMTDGSAAASASAAAMKEAMERARAKAKAEKEEREWEARAGKVRGERERARQAREREENKEEGRVQEEKDKETEREEREREEREREARERRRKEREKEKEREREREREKDKIAVEKATQEARERAERAAVERATAEARERAAADARERVAAERAAVERATAEARERAAAEAKERAAVERATLEARERAAAEARERAERVAVERAASEARARSERAAVERANAEARERAAERAAADARERAERAAAEKAAAAAREQQQQQQQRRNENDLEAFFSSSSRPGSAPRQRSPSTVDASSKGFSNEGSWKGSTAAPTSGVKKVPSASTISDDWTSLFGPTPTSGEFQEVEGESAERRRARLDRHQRTLERAAKALDEKNQRDLQTRREQEERQRAGDTLDAEIKRWAASKEGNLRALLSTLQYVLWPECGWQAVSLTDLITAAAVKKVYRKATLCVHPDKVQQKGATVQQKYIAEKVFDLLKEAWNKFNSEELF